MSFTNTLHFGDNLEILRHSIPDESVDLVYLDPPFNSNRAYNVIFEDKTGKKAASQIQAFEDTWHWSEETEDAYGEMMTGKQYPVELKKMLEAFRSYMGTSDMMAYLTMMAIRLFELRRVLKPTGSLYLHCDPTASHYLKLVLDQVFGVRNYRSEVVWKRTSSHSSANRWGPVHDVILFYSVSDKYVWNRVAQPYDETYVEKFYRHVDDEGRRYTTGDLTGAGTRKGASGKPWRGIDPTDKGRHWAIPRNVPGIKVRADSPQDALDRLDKAGRIAWPSRGGMPRFKRYLDDMEGVSIQDVITDIAPIGAHGSERLGYPTQKPVELLERIVLASSNEGDIVLDPFCGCGTTIAAAEKLDRKWIGIDITFLAVALIKKRILEHFPDSKFQVLGEPKSADDARALFNESAFQFESWAVSFIGGQPHKSTGGGDKGIDGFLYFQDYEKKYHKAIIEVKGGKYQPKDIRALASVIKREDAPLGILIALEKPTAGMKKEATAMGKWTLPGHDKKFPVLQIVTIKELFDGKLPKLPDTAGTLKKAQQIARTKRQKDLFGK